MTQKEGSQLSSNGLRGIQQVFDITSSFLKKIENDAAGGKRERKSYKKSQALSPLGFKSRSRFDFLE